jgi:hypothetical protein
VRRKGVADWQRLAAAVVGSMLLSAGAISILIGRADTPTIVLLVVAAPLGYAGFGVPVPSIKAAGAQLSFKSLSGKQTPSGPKED